MCGEKLGGDKDPVISERGFIYRKRICLSCHAEVRTKQGIEEITHVELPEDMRTTPHEQQTSIYYNTNIIMHETNINAI